MQLLDATEEAFCPEGYRGLPETTLKGTAELVRGSVGSLYSFCERKEHLYVGVLVQRGQEFPIPMRV